MLKEKREVERGRLRKEEERPEVMEAESGSTGHGADTNEAYPVHCSEDLLRPFFTDFSFQSIMTTSTSPSPRPESNRTPLSPPSDLRLVLLGRKGAGKSAAGNTILGAGFEFGKPTEECIKRRADVNGTKVTVVDTPGWEWYYPLNSTPNWVRRETLRSVTLCPPGPHAVLLVIRSCASVNEDYITEIEEHLLPLGTHVWEHAMALFTRGDELGFVSMEQRIQTSPGLQKLLQKCKNRYHVMDNRSKGEGTQGKELIRKLKEMVEEKKEKCKHLEMDNAALSELEVDATRRARERRKRQRQMEAQAQRGTIKTALMSDSLQSSEPDTRHSFSKTPRRLPEIRLVLLGERETGKSSAGNAILGQSGLFQSGTVTEECVRRQANISQRHVTVVDTPGWDGGVMGSTPERVKREIVMSVALSPPGPHAFLLTLRVDTAVRESHVCKHLELLGEDIWRYTMLLFTHCDQLREGVSIERHIQKGGKDLQTLLGKCKGRYHAMSNANGAQNAARVTELLEDVEKMATTNRCEAFSGLVGEVKSLSRQKNEKHSQRLKELQEKMSRQEAELKKLRDREMKSLRWFFERKKKSKSSGNFKKQDEEEEEEEGKRTTDQNVEELEERMRLMIEDKEREITDLNVEQERILATLHQSKREVDDAALNLEAKERGIEELNERIDEQQLKILDLERIAVGHEQERRQYTEAFRECEKVVQTLQRNGKMAMSECAEWREKAGKVNEDLERAKRRHEEEVGKAEQEKEIALKDFEVQMSKIEMLLSEKEKEFEQNRKIANEEKQKALDSIEENKQQMLKEMDEMTCRHKKELDDVKLMLNNEMQDKISEMDNRLETERVRHFEEIEQILKQQQNELNEKLSESENLKEQLAKEANANEESKRRELAAMRQKYLEIVKEKSDEYDNEMRTIVENHQQEIFEKDEEITKISEQIQDNMTRQNIEIERIREEFLKKLEEKENEIATMQTKHEEALKAKMSTFEKYNKQLIIKREKEIEDLKCKYADEINGKNKEIEIILKEKGEEIEKLIIAIEELKQKQMEKLESMAGEQVKLKESEHEIFKLKECLKEKEKKLQEFEAKKDREREQIELKLVEKEKLIQMLRDKLKDIEEMLQKKEDERGKLLLTQKKEMEFELEFRDKQIDEMKQQLLNTIEKKIENETLVEKLTNEIGRIRNERMSKEEENMEAVTSYVLEITKLKDCIQNLKEAEEGYRNKEGEMVEKLLEKEKDLDQMRLIIEQTKAELNELTQKMEREMTNLIQEYERGIEVRNQELEMIVTEKNDVIKCLQEEKQQKLLEVVDDFENSQKKVEEVEGKLAEEIQKLETKCQTLKEECDERDKQLHDKQSEFEEMCKNYKQEVLELGRINSQLQKEKEEMKEGIERQVAELAEKQEEYNELKQHLEQEIEIGKKEKLNFERKQEELVQWEVALMAKQSKLDEKDQERQKYIQQKEEELENVLKILETKQKELHFHGQDLQKKVRGLKDQGKELKDKEFSLRNQEQELMSWTSQLNAQNEQVSFTTQQLDEMGRELASLKRELKHKDQKYRLMFDNLNKWEVSLQEREAELSTKQNQVDYTHGEEDTEFMCQDIDRKDSFQEMAELACPKGNNCHFETLHEIAEQNESTETWNKQEADGVKVITGFKRLSKCPQNYKEMTDLTIFVLREAWSARSPSAVSILGGKGEKMSEYSDLNFTSWCGEISGRRVSIVEPRGLKWQDCTNASSENIRRAATWCESEPNIVLLVWPVFLTCANRKAIENTVNLVASDVWERTIVLFTWGETLGVSIEQHIQRRAEQRKLIEKCKGRYHVLTSRKNNSGIARLFEKMNEIVAINKREDLVAL